MENNLESKKPSAPTSAHSSLYEEALSLGKSAVHSAEHSVHDVEKFASEHKLGTAALAAGAAIAVGAAEYLTHGKAGTVAKLAEETLSLSSKEGLGAGGTLSHLSEQASELLGSSTLRRAASLAVVPLAALGLAGCEPDKKEAEIYKSPEDCAKDGKFTEKYCKDEFAVAQKEHLDTAPKFASQDECQTNTSDQCVASNPVNGDTSQPGPHPIFMPYMYGYMMGLNQNSNRSYTPMPGRSVPVYRSSGSDEIVTSRGNSVGSKPGSTEVEEESFANHTTSSTKPFTSSRSSGSVSEAGEGEEVGHSGVSRGGYGGGGGHAGGGGEGGE